MQVSFRMRSIGLGAQYEILEAERLERAAKAVGVDPEEWIHAVLESAADAALEGGE